MTVTITHTREEGTLVDGTARGDGSAEVLKARRFRWGRSISMWYIPQSRDRIADRYRIDGAAQALRDAGFDVEVTIDNAAEDSAEREDRRNERAEDRADALNDKATRKHTEASAAGDREREILDVIPPGQPILVGHHSERRHRRDLDRAENLRRRSAEARDEAHDAQQRAGAALQQRDRRLSSPDYVNNRITDREAQERKLLRNLAHKNTELARLEQEDDVAKLERYRQWYADCEAELDQVRRDLVFFREQLATLQASGVKVYTKDDLQPGDLVRVGFGWSKVIRANPKTVSVEFGQGHTWPVKYRYTEIKGHQRPEQTDA